MEAHQDGTRAQSSSGLKERVSETDTRKEPPLEGGSRPRGAKEAASLMEECLLAPHCRERHRATACKKFKGLSLQHRQSVIAEKEQIVCGTVTLTQARRRNASGGRPSPTGWAVV
jgi:hypothetical protein